VNIISLKKPSRYINSEINSIYKDAPVRVALAFPDIYEIGMSHLGLRILHHIINRIPYASAERVFSPWLDAEDAIKKGGKGLSSLESSRGLKEFDIVGFSLQYELSYATVLNMLHLGGIPLRSSERLERDAFPLVIAGGPCTANPAPMADFIDVFLIGDAEDAIHEILNVYLSWKKEDTRNKLLLLKYLSKIEGIYVPALGDDSVTRRRFIPSLDSAPYPDKPIVPFTSIVHDRVNIEVSRGCSMGCRFCQAGMIYRPVRERSPGKILELAERSLRHTGYDSVSFTSLSAGEYSCLLPLIKEFNGRFYNKKISLSLPSLRVASVRRDILGELRAVKKTGFTIAPEAGTERLRAVINKDFSEEEYIRALESLFKEGWQNLKLYFMTGLPTETDSDIEAIPDMVLKAIKISRRLTGKHVNISVGVSSFVPKPHSPFQWYGQNRLDVLIEKNRYLKRSLSRRGVKYKGHDEKMSLLEAMLARGDRSLSQLIETAWTLGCRLDPWTEAFDYEKWERAMDISGIRAEDFATRQFNSESNLPWDNIDTGISKDFLWREYQNALSEKFTPDCRKHCHNCGLKCETEDKRHHDEHSEQNIMATYGDKQLLQERGEGLRAKPVKVRLQYSKNGKARYLSHLELTTALIRAMRRAEFPFRYSEGFHPAPRISFGPALRVGISGLKEYIDAELTHHINAEDALLALNRTLPEGLHANKLEILTGGEKSLNSFIIGYMYEVKHNNLPDIEYFLGREEVIIQRSDRLFNLKDMIVKLTLVDNNTVLLALKDLGDIKVRLDEIIPEVFNAPVENLDVTRISMFGENGEGIGIMEGDKKWAVKY
jgi:radical SAM family uncharacterized protein/radical SAM-linked protein